MVPLNVPNVLTVVRILLVPVLVVALLEKSGSGDVLAAIVFAAASVTDAIDGYIARSRGSVTNFGKLMDPIADKLLIIAALVVLVSVDRLAAWVAMVIIAREFAVTVLRAGVGAGQGIVIPASPLGKAKTATQVLMVFCLIAFSPRPLAVSVIIYLTVAVTVLSGADYFFGLRHRLTRRPCAARPRARRGCSAACRSARRRRCAGGSSRD
jgi:CDP-diacylglycerol--glycerol-3-phosphate 3-phosphatidyltransferase